MSKNQGRKLLFLSTYPPRECGLATFTQDIVREMKRNKRIIPQIIAIDDGQRLYDGDVYARIPQHDREAYRESADLINKTGAGLLMIEHEYGIFGGPDGEWLLDLTERLQIPYMITCHTILPEPSERQREILARLCGVSAGVVVMSRHSKEVLEMIYGVEENKISLIHHGVPDFSGMGTRNCLKKKEGLYGETVVSTFGLISPGKGLEYGIHAVAQAARQHPEICYLILGPTHPTIKKEQGEAYRESLHKLADELKIGKNVRFANKYLYKKDIIHYLILSDIYMIPYLGKDQAVSGTLAYAIGCGRVVVSTPYLYAEEMLADGRGLLARFRDEDSLAGCLITLLENPGLRMEMERNAEKLGQTMTWQNIVLKLIEEPGKRELEPA